MNIHLLRPRWRILYLVYITKQMHEKIPDKQCILFSDLKEEFYPHELQFLDINVRNLIAEQVLFRDGEKIFIKQKDASPFLRIFSYIYESELALTRNKINHTIKHRDMTKIIRELVTSQVLMEYRTEFSRSHYLFPHDKKDFFITQINNKIINRLEQSEDLHDQAHLTMLQESKSILSYRDDKFCRDLNPNTSQIIVLVNLYNDIKIKKQKVIGRNAEFLVNKLFEGNHECANEAILSLVKKGFVRCSLNNKFYLNNHRQVLSLVKLIYLQNKHQVI